jgi:hypothetical protein
MYCDGDMSTAGAFGSSCSNSARARRGPPARRADGRFGFVERLAGCRRLGFVATDPPGTSDVTADYSIAVVGDNGAGKGQDDRCL